MQRSGGRKSRGSGLAKHNRAAAHQLQRPLRACWLCSRACVCVQSRRAPPHSGLRDASAEMARETRRHSPQEGGGGAQGCLPPIQCAQRGACHALEPRDTWCKCAVKRTHATALVFHRAGGGGRARNVLALPRGVVGYPAILRVPTALNKKKQATITPAPQPCNSATSPPAPARGGPSLTWLRRMGSLSCMGTSVDGGRGGVLYADLVGSL